MTQRTPTAGGPSSPRLPARAIPWRARPATVRNPAAQGRPDANHAAIVRQFEVLFCSVLDLHSNGGGCPDLLIGCAGVSALVEIKTEDGALRPNQVTFHRNWRGGKVRIVRSPEEAIEHVIEMRGRFK